MTQRIDHKHMPRREFLKQSALFGGAAFAGTGIASTLVACGGGAQSGTAQLQFWDMVWGPPKYIDAAKNLVARFNKEHPDIQVTYQSVPWTNWYQTFTTAIGSGTAPDVSTGAAYQSVQFYDSDAILPLDDLVEEWRKNGKLADFLPNTVDVLKYNGHYVALPWAIDIRVLFYRKDLFEQANIQPPTSWDDIKNAAQKLTGKGKFGMVASSDTGGTHYLYTLMLNNGGGIFTPDKKVNLMSPRNQEAIKFFSDLAKNGYISPASSGYQSTDATKAFGQGDAAMIIESPGIEDELNEDVRKQVAVMAPPKGPHGDRGTVFWVNNIMVYKQTQYPEQAKTFLGWWVENQKALWTEGGCSQLPARKSLADDAYFKNKEKLNYIIKEWVPLGKTTGFAYSSIFPQLNAIEGEGVMQTLTQDLLQKKDPVQAMQKAQSGIEGLMKS